MRIVLTGPSGSGKTTLARVLSNELGIPFIEQSAGKILLPEDVSFLTSTFPWRQEGHLAVIKLSNADPRFAWEFQYRLLKARRKLYKDNPNGIFDRSFIDNLVYFTLQTAHLTSEERCEEFYTEAMADYATLVDKTIQLSYKEQRTIEWNGSRVSNIFYQNAVDAIFDMIIKKYIGNRHLVTLYTRIFEHRLAQSIEFIKL